MNAFSITHSHLWQLAGWCMWHILWVGLAMGGVALATRPLVRMANADVRYLVAFGWFALLAVSPLPIGWWVWETGSRLQTSGPSNAEEGYGLQATGYSQSRNGPDVEFDSHGDRPDVLGNANQEVADQPAEATIFGDPESVELENPSQDPDEFVSSKLGFLVNVLPFLWLVGAPITFLLLATGMVGAERLRRQGRIVDDAHVVALLARLSKALGLQVNVALAVCDRLAGPILVGIIRPIILLPTASLGHWSPEQFEMVLLHELAHVRRWDNLVNLLQRVVESLLFFVPTVWLVSRWVRQEREHCCDCCVVRHTGKAREYAHTLVQLADRRLAAKRPTRAALSSLLTSSMAEHQLLARVRHILKHEDESMKVSRALLSSVVMMMAAFVAMIGWFGMSLSPAQEQRQDQSPAAESAPGDPINFDKPAAPTEPKKKTSDDVNSGRVEPVAEPDVELETPPATRTTRVQRKDDDDGGRRGRSKGALEKSSQASERKAMRRPPERGSLTVRFLDDLTISSDRVRVLESLKVQPGDVVKVGDELARFTQDDVERAQTEVDIAQVKVRAAKKVVEEIDRLAPKGVVPASQLEARHSELELAELNLKIETLKLESFKRPLTAPIAGTIAEVSKRGGETVKPGDPIVRIVNTDRFAVVGSINVTDFPIPKRGEKFRFTLGRYGIQGEDEPPPVFEGTIDFVSTEIDPEVGGISIRGIIENRDGILRAGMSGKLVLVSDEAQRLQNPQDDPYVAWRIRSSVGADFGEGIARDDAEFAEAFRNSDFRGGVRLRAIRSNGPADKAGIEPGDILVGLAKWETASFDDLIYIFTQSSTPIQKPMTFYVLRKGKTLKGEIQPDVSPFK